MRLKEYFRSFTEDELKKGAELFFAGDLKEENGKAPAGKKAKNTAKNEVVISGVFTELDTTSRKKDYRCRIGINTKYQLISFTECGCEQFSEDYYGCRHAAALLTSYMIKENGEDVFYGTRLEELLRNMTNTEDPFQPGVLKRTDDRLLSLLKDETEAALPVWKETVAEKERLKIKCSLDIYNDVFMAELSVGAGRTYIIRDIPDFLTAYSENEVYQIGKNNYVLSRGLFDPFSASLLDFLSGIHSAYQKGIYGKGVFINDGNKGARYISLLKIDLDGFMELFNGRTINLNGMDEIAVDLDRKGLKALIRKKAYGASLEVTPSNYIGASEDWIYFYDSNGIFRVKTDSRERTKELLSLLSWNEPLYIRESDIGNVCQRLLPCFRNYGSLITKGIEPDDYEKEQPEFIFKLDYPSSHMLSCVPYVSYPKQDFECRLFDNETNAVKRNAEAEGAVADMLPSYFQGINKKDYSLYAELNEEELYVFMKDFLPLLEELGTVMVTEKLKKRRVRFLPPFSARIAVKEGSLLLSLNATGLSDDEMDEILTGYRQKKRYFRLKSGEFMSLEDTDSDTWETLSELYHSYGMKDPKNIKIPVFRALYLKEMLENRDDTYLDTSDEYRKLIMSMSDVENENYRIPSSLSGIIRPYQNEGFRWIKMLKKCGFGGILADDMGLGKTLQILSFVLSEKEEGKSGDELRTLVICPASLVYNWQREIETYAGSLSAVVVAGTTAQRKEIIENSPDADIWITSYDLLKRDISLYEDIHFANEVVDEAQFIKNQNTQAAQSVRIVSSGFRMALTGTPIENHLGELWSIMDYLMPGFLYSYTRFQKEFELPIVTEKDENQLSRLRRMVHPFILRRLKKQVLKELPDKLEETVTVRLTGEQKKLYDASVEKILSALNSVKDSEFRSEKLQFLAMLTRLRQVCCDPSLVYEDYRGESAKLEACMQLVRQAVDGGHKLLLFSQFTSMLDIICAGLKENGIEYHRLDGSVGKDRRMQMVDSFANDEVPVFCISLKAGGTGLNLTAADIVIHYDPWWNQAAQDQATDRTHRIGQTQRVTVYELIALDTVEERIQKIKEGKRELVEDVLSGGEISSTKIDKDDMLALLA